MERSSFFAYSCDGPKIPKTPVNFRDLGIQTKVSPTLPA